MNWKKHNNSHLLKYGATTAEIKELQSCFEILVGYRGGAIYLIYSLGFNTPKLASV